MIPGRATATDNDLIKRLVRENGALSVGMYWDNLAFSEVTDVAGYHATYFLDHRPGREPRRHGRRLGRRVPRRQVPGRRRRATGGRRLPRAQQLGRRLGRGRLLLGLLLRQVLRPRPGAGRLRRRDLLRGRRRPRQLHARLPVRQAGRHRPLGLRQHAGVGRQPVHGHVDAAHRRRRASTRCPPPPGTRSGPAARCGLSACAPPAPSSCPATPPCRSPPGCASRQADDSWSRSSWSHPARHIPWPSSDPDAAGCPAPRPEPARAT